MKWKVSLLIIGFVLAFGFGSAAHAQATGTISGFITDTTGLAISGATVTLTEEGTGATRKLQTDNSGHFVAALLPVGHYTIDVLYQGFQEQKRTGIPLETQGSSTVSLTLSPASEVQTVDVIGQTEAQIETTDATLSQVINSQEVAELPLNGRDFVQLALLTPGTTAGVQPGDFFTNANTSSSEVAIRGSYSLSVGGSRENRTDWLYDDVDNNELTAGGIAVLPSIDALNEFNVLTYNYSARYGSRAGPTVLLTSKSGSNQFHGTLFDFLRNTALNSRNYFATTNPKYIQNQFGGSIGGPIIHNKTFFFFDYQGTRNIQGMPTVAQIPTPKEINGDFTDSFEPVIYNPFLPGRPQFVGDDGTPNKIPSRYLSSIAQTMLGYFPQLSGEPASLYGDYLSVPNRTFHDNEFDFRIDHTFRDRDRIFARFSRDQASVFDPSGLPGFGTQPGGWGSNQNLNDHGRNLALSETHSFSTSKINQVTVGYNRIFNHIRSYGDGTDWSTKLGIPNANLGTYFSSGLMSTVLSDGYWALGDRGFSPFQGGSQIYHFADDFEWIHGAHALSMGGSMRFMQMNIMGDAWPMGQMVFTDAWTSAVSDGALVPGTGDSLASFLIGLPYSVEHDDAFAGTITGRRWKEFRPYVQDTWTLSKNLSVQLGMAYNFTTPLKEAHNRQSNFDMATGILHVPGINTDAATGVQAYKWAFEPRLSFSYSPFSSKNAIRGGYAIMHDAGWNLGARGPGLNPPAFNSYQVYTDNMTLAGTPTLAGGFPVPQQQTATTAANLTGMLYSQPKNFQPGRVQQFNINVQRDLPSAIVLTVGYAGMRSSHQQTDDWNLNTPPPNTQANPSALSPYPTLSMVNGILDRGMARYDSLQIKAEKTVHSGLYFLLSYTYSKGTDNGLYDDVSSVAGIAYFPIAVADSSGTPLSPHVDKGLSTTDQTHNFSASALYQLPFGHGKRWGGSAKGWSEQIIGSWQLNVISHMASGFPFGVIAGTNFSGTTGFGNRADQTCNGKLSHHTVTEFFDTSCFSDPAAGVMGNASRTPLYGPDFINFDVSLFKTFRTTEKGPSLQFRTETFNVFNHPQFALPGNYTDSSGFGQIGSTVNNPRLIQFALKLIF
jgi:hypothetical protein